MGDYTTVRVTLNTRDETAFLKKLSIESDKRSLLDEQFLVELTFHEWNRPEVTDFFVSNIVFLGIHDRGDEYGPYRFCSNGAKTADSPCDDAGRLVAPIDVSEGRLMMPELEKIRAYFRFEDLCRRGLESQIETVV